MTIIKICQHCKKEFKAFYKNRKYCSRKCYGLAESGEKHPMYGKHYSAETRKKLSDAQKGQKRKPLTEEHKLKISKGNKGKIISIETRKKVSKAMKGKYLGKNNHLWRGGVNATKQRKKDSLKYRLNKNMRTAIYQTLHSNKNGRHWETLVGYKVEQLKKHLEKTLPNGTTWQDYLNGEFQIDHIIPISVFNFDKPEHLDFKRCWALNNLQLLKKYENQVKSAKLKKAFQPSLAL